MSQILPIMYRPDSGGGVTGRLSERSFLDEVREELGITDLKVVTTGAGQELGRGRGGGHCMTCPVVRDA